MSGPPFCVCGHRDDSHDSGNRMRCQIPGCACACYVPSLKSAPEPPPADPWRHRSAAMKCKTCMWFVAKARNEPAAALATGEPGRCRRHAPTLGGYPAVFEQDWCGDHKLDENKL